MAGSNTPDMLSPERSPGAETSVASPDTARTDSVPDTVSGTVPDTSHSGPSHPVHPTLLAAEQFSVEPPPPVVRSSAPLMVVGLAVLCAGGWMLVVAEPSGVHTSVGLAALLVGAALTRAALPRGKKTTELGDEHVATADPLAWMETKKGAPTTDAAVVPVDEGVEPNASLTQSIGGDAPITTRATDDATDTH